MARRPRLRFSIAAGSFFLTVTLGLISACARVEPVAIPPAPAGFPTNVEQLRGLAAAALTRRLGEPDFVRVEPPGVIWQYRSDDCVLELILYPSGDQLLVAYAEARDRELTRAGEPGCYAEIVALRARPL